MGVFVVLHSDVEKEPCVTFDILEPAFSFGSTLKQEVQLSNGSIHQKLNHSENMGLLADQYLFIHDELQRFEVEPRFFPQTVPVDKVEDPFREAIVQH